MTCGHEAQAEASTPEAPVTIRVQRQLRGWLVWLPDRPEAIMCDTLDEARRVAYLSVAGTPSCELIVHDAYHRVLHRELVDEQRRQGRDQSEPHLNRRRVRYGGGGRRGSSLRSREHS